MRQPSTNITPLNPGTHVRVSCRHVNYGHDNVLSTSYDGQVIGLDANVLCIEANHVDNDGYKNSIMPAETYCIPWSNVRLVRVLDTRVETYVGPSS